MAGVNWGGIANSGFDAFGNFQGGWEVGSSSGTGYETFTNILNLAGQVAPTLGPAGAAFGIGLNQAAAVNNTVSTIDKYNNGTIQPSDVLQITGSVLGGLAHWSRLFAVIHFILNSPHLIIIMAVLQSAEGLETSPERRCR
jgi:hypothetical protein